MDLQVCHHDTVTAQQTTWLSTSLPTLHAMIWTLLIHAFLPKSLNGTLESSSSPVFDSALNKE
jgi:hypothetical protein